MAKIESKKENEFLTRSMSQQSKSYSTTQSYWIGLVTERTPEDDSMLIWSDGQAVSRYSGFWAKQQPDYSQGSCVKGSTFKDITGLQWSMEMCNLMLPFVCQLPACVSGKFREIQCHCKIRLLYSSIVFITFRFFPLCQRTLFT